VSVTPDPMTPPDCDLRGLEYMPLLGGHLFGSEFNARANDSEWRAALTLWWAAWCQVPAASLPDDDAALCRFADLGRDLKTWKKLRDGALHGWVKCADGRLYHPVLAEQALIAWDKRKQDRESRSSSAERKAREREARSQMFAQLAAVNVTPEWNIRTADLRALVTHHCAIPSQPPVTPVTPPVTPVTPPVTLDVTAKTGRDGTGHKEEREASHAHANDAPPTGPPGSPIHAAIMEAAGFTHALSARDRQQLGTWQGQGLDLHEDILPVLRRLREREHQRGKSIGSLTYADSAIQEQRAADRREKEYLKDVADRYGGGGPH
jgi:uncharacterized protein YdaU (DUF1376 family)